MRIGRLDSALRSNTFFIGFITLLILFCSANINNSYWAHASGSKEMKHSNRLKNEKSPYLLQHADNPVDWYPWGEEAFEKARKENKPILLSIGYSTCHWCHVMEHESFEDEEVAKLMNETFVSIKVDRRTKSLFLQPLTSLKRAVMEDSG